MSEKTSFAAKGVRTPSASHGSHERSCERLVLNMKDLNETRSALTSDAG